MGNLSLWDNHEVMVKANYRYCIMRGGIVLDKKILLINLKMLCGVKEARTDKFRCPLISEGGIGTKTSPGYQKFVDFQSLIVGPPSY